MPPDISGSLPAEYLDKVMKEIKKMRVPGKIYPGMFGVRRYGMDYFFISVNA
jgi:hypothetical protein